MIHKEIKDLFLISSNNLSLSRIQLAVLDEVIEHCVNGEIRVVGDNMELYPLLSLVFNVSNSLMVAWVSSSMNELGVAEVFYRNQWFSVSKDDSLFGEH